MSFPARHKGTCTTCGKEIKVGQHISWSRRERDKAYHTNCDNPDAIPVTSSLTPEMIMKMVADMLAASKATTPEEEPTEAEMHGSTATLGLSATVTKLPKKPEAHNPAAMDENTPWWIRLETLLNGGINRILLIGPPGTGKSKTAMLLSDTEYEVTMTEGMAVEDLLGMFQLIDGATKWVDGPVISAMREGKRIIVNEIDHHPTEISSLLYALMDDNPAVMLPTGERVIAKAEYGVIGTSNANVVSLPDAILDRCDAVINAILPHDAALGLIEDKASRATCANYFKALDNTPWRWSRKPTLRTMHSFRRMVPIVGETIAAECAFGAAGAEMLSTISTADRTGEKAGL